MKLPCKFQEYLQITILYFIGKWYLTHLRYHFDYLNSSTFCWVRGWWNGRHMIYHSSYLSWMATMMPGNVLTGERIYEHSVDTTVFPAWPTDHFRNVLQERPRSRPQDYSAYFQQFQLSTFFFFPLLGHMLSEDFFTLDIHNTESWSLTRQTNNSHWIFRMLS